MLCAVAKLEQQLAATAGEVPKGTEQPSGGPDAVQGSAVLTTELVDAFLRTPPSARRAPPSLFAATVAVVEASACERAYWQPETVAHDLLCIGRTVGDMVVVRCDTQPRVARLRYAATRHAMLV